MKFGTSILDMLCYWCKLTEPSQDPQTRDISTERDEVNPFTGVGEASVRVRRSGMSHILY